MAKHSKFRFVAQGFRQIKQLHYEKLSSPAPAVNSTRVALATAAVMYIELHHINFEPAYLLADVDTEIYNELPEEYREFPDAVGKLNKGYLRLGAGGGILEHETD